MRDKRWLDRMAHRWIDGCTLLIPNWQIPLLHLLITSNTQIKLYYNHCNALVRASGALFSTCHSYLVLLQGRRQLCSHCISTMLCFPFLWLCAIRASEKITHIAFTSADLTRRRRLVISPCQLRRGRPQTSKQNVRAAVWWGGRCNTTLSLSCVVLCAGGRCGMRWRAAAA